RAGADDEHPADRGGGALHGVAHGWSLPNAPPGLRLLSSCLLIMSICSGVSFLRLPEGGGAGVAGGAAAGGWGRGSTRTGAGAAAGAFAGGSGDGAGPRSIRKATPAATKRAAPTAGIQPGV